MTVSGIYKIVNKTNSKYYVGSSRNIISRRWRHHKTILRHGNHFNSHLQNAWNKYGEQNFEFLIVENVSENELLNVEQKYLDIAEQNQNKCYNTTFVAGCGPGIKKGTLFSDDHKKNLSKSHIGQKSWNKGQTKETNSSIMKISNFKKGKVRNEIAKNYLFLDPDRNLVNILNLKQFCKNNKLTYTTMNLLFHGKGGYKSHKGWTRYV